MPQLTVEEQKVIHRVVMKEKRKPGEALQEINAARKKAKVKPLGKTAVYSYVSGETHEHGATERRGRKRSLSPGDVAKLQVTRRRLIKAANSAKRVTYEDIMDKTELKKEMPSERTVADALRADGVSYKKPREKIQLTDKDAKVRLETLQEWIKHPPRFWKSMHAYVDNKAFVMPLTPEQKIRYRQTKVTGHLRTASEGTEQGFTKPRDKHSWTGIPSVSITAAVALDKVILWHVNTERWNGQTAANMYRGPLLKALRRTWGKKKAYTIVEDGDRTGNQSTKGIKAKEDCGITAMTLPPRTPALMPLDFALWKQIEDLMFETEPAGRESKAAFLARLKKCAQSLPKGAVSKQIGRIKANIQDIIDAGGYHGKSD